MSWECQWEGRNVEWGVYSAGRLKHCMYLCVIVNVYAITIVRISEKPSVVIWQSGHCLQVLHQTEDHRKRVLMSAQKEIRPWIIKVKKIKAIYHTLNMCNFDVSHNSLIAECWTPVSGLEEIQSALKHGTVSYQGRLRVTNVVWNNLKSVDL